MVGLLLAGTAQAQQATPTQPVPATDAVQDDFQAHVQADSSVTTLGEVRALKPEDEPLDLYRFKNPVQPQPNRFSKSWSEPPTPEQVSMSGGYLLMGISYGLMAAAKGLHKLSNGRDQIQSAVARPPPELTEQQQRRADAFCEAGACVEKPR